MRGVRRQVIFDGRKTRILDEVLWGEQVGMLQGRRPWFTVTSPGIQLLFEASTLRWRRVLTTAK